MKKLFFFFLFVLSACTPQAQVTPIQVVTVYATSAAEPWLSGLFTCADSLSVVLNVTAGSPDISLRVGEPETIISPIYQIDEEEILIVTNHESSVQNLNLAEAQELFAQGNPSAQVWVFTSEADVQVVFDQLVMKGRSITSSAKLATSPQQMSDLLNAEKDSVGVLPRHWKAGSVREVFSAGTVPVLAITKSEPQGVVGELIACLQNN